VPGFQFLLESYAGKVRALGIVWLAYAGLSLVLGAVGLSFAHAFLGGHFGPHFGPWMNGPWARGPLPPMWFGPAMMHFAWAFLVVRACVALVAGWGLLERTEWGRVVAIVAAVFSLLRFPIGTVLGIWTLVLLLGYRNTTLYEQLQ
jgi:hypothetical protein